MLRLHRGWHHHHARARTETGLVGSLYYWLRAKGPDLRIVAQVPDDPRPLGIGLGKNQPGLLAAVNGALAAMRRDGSLNQLKKKWSVP